MKRPELKRTDLDQVMKSILGGGPPLALVTMSIGQWDGLLESAYENGLTLLELDYDEKPVGAYQNGNQ